MLPGTRGGISAGSGGKLHLDGGLAGSEGGEGVEGRGGEGKGGVDTDMDGGWTITLPLGGGDPDALFIFCTGGGTLSCCFGAGELAGPNAGDFGGDGAAFLASLKPLGIITW